MVLWLDAMPTFGFASTEPGSTFACRIDGNPLTACSSPHPTSPLAGGGRIALDRRAARRPTATRHHR
jgi:hypothetical protein